MPNIVATWTKRISEHIALANQIFYLGMSDDPADDLGPIRGHQIYMWFSTHDESERQILHSIYITDKTFNARSHRGEIKDHI